VLECKALRGRKRKARKALVTSLHFFSKECHDVILNFWNEIVLGRASDEEEMKVAGDLSTEGTPKIHAQSRVPGRTEG
jgi:hypothetical protein